MASRVSQIAGACLGDETIAAMLEGGLAADTAHRARAHIGGCDACRRLVSAAIDADGPPVPASSATLTSCEAISPGAVIAGRYRIEQLLGEGGMGRVFAARQLGLERPVALKVLRPELARDGTALKRFHREARLVASLVSERVVRVHDLGELATGEPYLVMELLEGEDLGHVVARGPVAVERATAFILDACEALAEAHSLGIVHRDIKPSNLFLTGAQRIKVLDFGLAKLARVPSTTSTGMTGDGALLGSPRYMAPEQIMEARDVDARADIWSLGATLYHLVTGTAPFAGEKLDRIFAGILAGKTPPLDGVPDGVAAVIRRCLSREPQARYLSVGELAEALRRAPRVDHPGEASSIHQRYEILEPIGQGGHGTVYRARQRPHGREVALKVLRVDATRLRERFAREAAIVEKLEHPNTVRLFESGHASDGAPFMVFELVRGRTLRAELAKGPLPPARVARIAAQVLKALMEAHQHGIVHRDVKPENVMLVDHAGEPDYVKLLDFGVAVDAAQAGLTTTGQVIGTPLYMSPEQVTGAPVDLRADLYALGLVMAEAIGGAPVIRGDSAMAVCAQHASAAPVPLSRAVTASTLGAVVGRATEKSPHARFGSAREMLDAVETAMTLTAGMAGMSPVAAPMYATAPLPYATTLAAQSQLPPAAAAPRSRSSSSAPLIITVIVVIVSVALAAVCGVGFVIYKAVASTEGAPPAAGAPPAPGGGSAASGGGKMANFDENRMRARLERQGWKITRVTKQSFPGCKHTDFLIDKGPVVNANALLLECSSRGVATSEGARLGRGNTTSWIIVDADRVLYIAAFEEKVSKELAEALLVP